MLCSDFLLCACLADKLPEVFDYNFAKSLFCRQLLLELTGGTFEDDTQVPGFGHDRAFCSLLK